MRELDWLILRKLYEKTQHQQGGGGFVRDNSPP